MRFLLLHLSFEISNNGGAVHESKDYFILHRVQTAQLQHNEKQKEQSWQVGDEQVLQILQEAHSPQRNQIINGGLE